LKYANSTHALRALLRVSDGEEESKRGKITKFSTMIHTSREGLDYYFVEVVQIDATYFLFLLPRVIFFRYLIYACRTISMIGNVNIDLNGVGKFHL
jgi:hypothetical protein